MGLKNIGNGVRLYLNLTPKTQQFVWAQSLAAASCTATYPEVAEGLASA